MSKEPDWLEEICEADRLADDLREEVEKLKVENQQLRQQLAEAKRLCVFVSQFAARIADGTESFQYGWNSEQNTYGYWHRAQWVGGVLSECIEAIATQVAREAK